MYCCPLVSNCRYGHQPFRVANALWSLTVIGLYHRPFHNQSPFHRHTETRLGFKLALRLVDYIGWVLHP